MKLIFATMALAVAGLFSSCEVRAPLDPKTFEPSRKCCPENYYPGYSTTCGSCGREANVSSK